MQDCKSEAERQWKNPEIRAEFADDINVLIAYLENQHRAKIYRSGHQAKAKDEPKADTLDDATLKARWNASKSLQEEFSGNFEAYRAYELNKNRVKVMN